MNKSIEVVLGDIVRGLKTCERTISKRGEDIVRARFEQGCLLKDVVGNTKYGENVVSRIANEAGIPEATLRIAYGHAKRFSFREANLEREFAKLKEAGKNISYSYFRAALQENRNPDVHGGKEKHKDHLLKKYEEAGEALHEARTHYPDDPEVQGAIATFESVAEDAEFTILGKRGTSGIKKGGRWQCEAYLKFIREHKCCVSGLQPVEAHHLILKSRGGQASDLFTVPLTSELHQEYHRIGHNSFVDKYNVNFEGVVITLIQSFITELLR
jgi:hypothetical protein